MGNIKETQIQDVYVFYVEYVKPLYAEIEAENNTLPVELLFEIHAAFDHLKRFYVDGENEEESAQKACSHLKRGALDAYKLKLKYFNKDLKKLKWVDMSLIDNGKLYAEFLKDKNEIKRLGKEARLSEGKKDREHAFDLWDQNSAAINTFTEKYFLDTKKISWAKRKTILLWCWSTFITAFVGFLVGIASSYLVWLATQSS